MVPHTHVTKDKRQKGPDAEENRVRGVSVFPRAERLQGVQCESALDNTVEHSI